jgi:hypothetical protein
MKMHQLTEVSSDPFDDRPLDIEQLARVIEELSKQQEQMVARYGAFRTRFYREHPQFLAGAVFYSDPRNSNRKPTEVWIDDVQDTADKKLHRARIRMFVNPDYHDLIDSYVRQCKRHVNAILDVNQHFVTLRSMRRQQMFGPPENWR